MGGSDRPTRPLRGLVQTMWTTSSFRLDPFLRDAFRHSYRSRDFVAPPLFIVQSSHTAPVMCAAGTLPTRSRFAGVRCAGARGPFDDKMGIMEQRDLEVQTLCCQWRRSPGMGVFATQTAVLSRSNKVRTWLGKRDCECYGGFVIWFPCSCRSPMARLQRTWRR